MQWGWRQGGLGALAAVEVVGPSRCGRAPWPELAVEEGGGGKEGGRHRRARVSPELRGHGRLRSFYETLAHRGWAVGTGGGVLRIRRRIEGPASGKACGCGA